MKKYKLNTCIIILLLSIGGLHAQESILASGGNSIGIGGSTIYSLGQVFYTTNTGGNGSVAQGVQQPYEIFTILGIEDVAIRLDINAFPNPVTNHLILEIEDANRSSYSYQIIDMNERILKSSKLITNSTIINMERFSAATYFLNIKDRHKIIKTFKIIKN